MEETNSSDLIIKTENIIDAMHDKPWIWDM